MDIKARFLVRRAGDDVEFGDEMVLTFGSASDTVCLLLPSLHVDTLFYFFSMQRNFSSTFLF